MRIATARFLIPFLAVIALLSGAAVGPARAAAAPMYGAWAWSGTGGLPSAVSAAVGATPAQAEAAAVSACRAAGGGTGGHGACYARVWFANAYSSLAAASNGAWGVTWNSSRAAARSGALSYCAQEGGKNCRIVGNKATPYTSAPNGAVIQPPPSYGVWAISPTAKLARWGVGNTIRGARRVAVLKCMRAGGVPAECSTYGAWAENGYSAISRGANRTWSISVDVSPASADALARHECKTVKAVGLTCTLKGTGKTGDPWVGTRLGWIKQPTDWAGKSFCKKFPKSKASGAALDGVAACKGNNWKGGRVYYKTPQHKEIVFESAPRGVRTWQCTELAARWFYVDTGHVAPLVGAGRNVARQYHNKKYKKHKKYPVSKPSGTYRHSIHAGDIISMWGGPKADKYGHVAIVTHVFVKHGTGKIHLIEENGYTRTGAYYITVKNGHMSYGLPKDKKFYYTHFQWLSLPHA